MKRYWYSGVLQGWHCCVVRSCFTPWRPMLHPMGTVHILVSSLLRLPLRTQLNNQSTKSYSCVFVHHAWYVEWIWYTVVCWEISEYSNFISTPQKVSTSSFVPTSPHCFIWTPAATAKLLQYFNNIYCGVIVQESETPLSLVVFVEDPVDRSEMVALLVGHLLKLKKFKVSA